MRIRLPNNWQPRPDQMKLWCYLEDGGTRAVEVAHRRWGKDDVCLHYAAVAQQQRIGNYWHMLPEYGQARKAIWDAVNPATGKRRIDESFPDEIRSATKQQEMMIKFKSGSTWQLVGSDNYNSLVGSPPVGVVNSEYALSDPAAWAYLDPILMQNGGWGIFIYTPRGKSHGYTMYNHAKLTPGWFAELLTAEQTPVFTATQLRAILANMQGIYGPAQGLSLFNQEYMCSFEAVLSTCFFMGCLDGHDPAPGILGRLVRDKRTKEVEFINDLQGNVEIWRYPYLMTRKDEINYTHRYCIGSDISEGLGGDYSIAYVFDRKLSQYVARMFSNIIDSHKWADREKELADFYGDHPLHVPERNGAGITTINRLVELKENVYVKEIVSGIGKQTTKQYGYLETKEAKQRACGELKSFIAAKDERDARKHRIFCKNLLSECSTFIKDEANEKMGAEVGFHDDHIMAAAMARIGDAYLPKCEAIPVPLTGWRARDKDKEKVKTAWAA